VYKKLCDGNLPVETTEANLKEFFAQSGDKAIAAMNGKDFNGRTLTVNEARPMPSRNFRGGFKRN
jgi:RNA recognition motif-containing protein